MQYAISLRPYLQYPRDLTVFGMYFMNFMNRSGRGACFLSPDIAWGITRYHQIFALGLGDHWLKRDTWKIKEDCLFIFWSTSLLWIQVECFFLNERRGKVAGKGRHEAKSERWYESRKVLIWSRKRSLRWSWRGVPSWGKSKLLIRAYEAKTLLK